MVARRSTGGSTVIAMRDGGETTKQPEDELVIYRCTECGKVSTSVGWLHAHIEGRHTGFGPFNFIPNPLKIGSFENDMKMTEVIRVREYDQPPIEEIENVQ